MFCVLCVFTLCLRFYVMFYVCIVSRAGSVSVFGVGIGIRYWYFEILGIQYRYRYFWNAGWKSQIFGTPTSIWRPCWGWPRRNFTVGVSIGKLEWWGHQMMKKIDSKFGHFDTSTWQTDGQTDTARQPRPRTLWVASRGKHLWFSHYDVLMVCFCYTLLINDCLVWSIA